MSKITRGGVWNFQTSLFLRKRISLRKIIYARYMIMRTIIPKLLRLFFLTFTLTVVCLNDTRGDDRPESRIERPTRALIEATFAGVDRVVVKDAPQGRSDKDYEAKVFFELRGRDAMESLQKTLEFNLPQISEENTRKVEGLAADGASTIEILVTDDMVPCLCYGTHNLYFYAGDTQKFFLNYKHFSRFGGLGNGEFDLTPESSKKFAAWFNERGFPDFQKGVDEIAEILRGYEEKAKRVAAMFPEIFRKEIPPYSRIEAKDYIAHQAKLEKIVGILNSRNDRLEIITTAWRAIGKEYSERDYRLWSPEIEPLATLRELGMQGSATEAGQIISNATETDADLYAGLFKFIDDDDSFRKLVPEEMRAKIYAYIWKHSRDMQWRVALGLMWESGTHCKQLRLDIAASAEIKPGMPPAEDAEYAPPYSRTASSLGVLFRLAKKQVPEARSIIVGKLKNAPEGYDKLVLEIALACYDGVGILRKEHFELKDFDVRSTIEDLQKSAVKSPHGIK